MHARSNGVLLIGSFNRYYLLCLLWSTVEPLLGIIGAQTWINGAKNADAHARRHNPTAHTSPALSAHPTKNLRFDPSEKWLGVYPNFITLLNDCIFINPVNWICSVVFLCRTLFTLPRRNMASPFFPSSPRFDSFAHGFMCPPAIGCDWCARADISILECCERVVDRFFLLRHQSKVTLCMKNAACR